MINIIAIIITAAVANILLIIVITYYRYYGYHETRRARYFSRWNGTLIKLIYKRVYAICVDTHNSNCRLSYDTTRVTR